MIIDGVQWRLARGVDAGRWEARLRAALRAAAGGGSLKEGRRKQLYSLALDSDEPDHLLKVYHYDRGASWSRRLGRSRSHHELAIAERLARAGVATPMPVGAGQRRRVGLLEACYLLVPIRPGHLDLLQWLAGEPPASERRIATSALGRLARRLHDLGLDQDDFAPNNFLIDTRRPDCIVPIDFERARWRRATLGDECNRMLAKLERHCFSASSATRLRFLRAYEGDRARVPLRAADVAAESARLIERDVARLERVATSASRRFRAITHREWSGWSRRDTAWLEQAYASLRGSTSSGPAVESATELWRVLPDPAVPAEVTWANAQALWIRDLSPRPVCLLRGPAGTRLFLERDERSADGGRADHRAAVTILLDRLLGLGRIGPDRITSVIRIEADGSAFLVDPSAFRAEGARGSGRRSAARSLADAWVAGA